MSDIFDQIVSLENLFSAWREFRRGKRGRQDVQEFERHLEDNVFALHADLVNGQYRHGSYHRFHIFDPKHRIIHKASVRDRLVHHAVYRVLYPLFDRSFIFDSYSCRIGKGTHAAVDRLEQFTRQVSRNNTRPCWALKFDIRKFFDSVDHEILMGILSSSLRGRLVPRSLGEVGRPKQSADSRIASSGVLSQAEACGYHPPPAVAKALAGRRNDTVQVVGLLNEIVGSYSTSNSVGGRFQGKTGLPIGNLTSQLFANIYLDAFDHFIKDELRVKQYIRYTDDAVILANDPGELRWLLPFLMQWLWHERRLTLHPNKVSIRKLQQGIDFLGYVTFPHHRVLRTKTKRRMLMRATPKNMPSYMGLLEHCNGFTLHRLLTLR